MKRSILALLITLNCASFARAEELKSSQIPNPKINYEAFLLKAEEVADLRERRRITETEFITLSADPDTVILDARSTEKYQLLHVKGAKNLSLPDITEEELSRIIPSKNTRVLIYCNNNFENAPKAFPGKMATASLNIYTFNTLHAYGYTNIYELGPLVDINTSILPFEGTQKNDSIK